MEKKHPHDGHRQRVRERYLASGLEGFAPHEILELLLFYCYPRQNTNEIAHKILNEYGTLHNLFEADAREIMAKCNISLNVAVLISLMSKLANVYFRGRWDRNDVVMDNIRTVSEYAMSLFVGHKNESSYIFCLDAGLRLKNVSLVAEGTLSETPIYPIKIVEETIKHKSTSLILVHNHPGGTPRPSKSDIDSTLRLFEGLRFLGLTLLDHVIVAGDRFYSFAANEQIVAGY